MKKNISISLSVITDDQEAAAEVAEQLARTAVALALRDFTADVQVLSFDYEEDSDD